jgi:phenylpyruvate tautomerase PptA (4-oxalocrotonate tautomerase family)
MPVITVTLIEGYSEDVRRRLEERLTDAARVTIGAVPDGITIIVNEVPAANYMRGRTGRIPGAPPPQPAELVLGFLAAMEARDLDKARSFLAEGFIMTFPGGVRFTKLEELVEWSIPRYRMVRKTFEAVEEGMAEGGAVVHCHGTLSGVWLDGTEFEGIRFIDRFTVSDGKLIDQMVWNDMAEIRFGGD